MSSAPSDTPPRPPRFSLAARITTWYVLALLVSIAALLALAIPALRAVITEHDTVTVEAKIDRHLAILSQQGLGAYRAAVEHSSSLEDETAVRVRDRDGRTLFEHGNVAASVHTATRATAELRLDVGDTRDPWAAISSRLRTTAGLAVLLATALALLGGYYVTRRALAPLRALAATARDVSTSGDLTRRVPERSTSKPDELDDLARLVNRMLERNQRLVRGMRDALDNVAHDLRTPLTRLRGTAELALTSTDPASTREALTSTIEESEHILSMLRTLMDISEAEAGLVRLDRAPASLASLARDTVDLYEQVAEDAGVTLTLATTKDVSAPVDAPRIRRAIANLVDNAIKYTPHGGRVTLEIDDDPHTAYVRVRDTGEGIPSEALPRIWDRLYRADPSRTRPGLGLGLSFVRAIAEAHGGTVEAESVLGAGSLFTIALPKSALP
jgi:signal transduction histidine kinase